MIELLPIPPDALVDLQEQRQWHEKYIEELYSAFGIPPQLLETSAPNKALTQTAVWERLNRDMGATPTP